MLAVDSSFYAKYSERMAENVAHIDSVRLGPMRTFFGNQISSRGVQPDLPVFYPFAGGDFLHVNQVYPEATEYRLFALEPIGVVPDYSMMEDMDSVLIDTETMLRDIFKRSYFITKNMEEDIESDNRMSGLIYTLLWAIATSDHSVYSVEHMDLDSMGNATTRAVEGRAVTFDKGIRIGFMADGDTAMSFLSYLDCNISNKGLDKDTVMLAHLNGLPQSNTYMKAASYLPHYKSFSSIREIVLDKSQAIIQDDTGIPWKHVDQEVFDVALFGVYAPPVSDFTVESLYQKDLERDYEDDRYYAGKLPFSLGYHWNSKLQNQMMFVRK